MWCTIPPNQSGISQKSSAYFFTNIRPMITENTRIEDVPSTLCQKQFFLARTNYLIRSSRFTPGETFHFRARTLNEDGEGAPSGSASLVAAASSGWGIPTNVTVTSAPPYGTTVSWTAPTDLLNGEMIRAYFLYRSENNGNSWTYLSPLSASTTSYMDNSLTVGSKYGYSWGIYKSTRRKSS